MRRAWRQLRDQWMGALALFLVIAGGTAWAVERNSVRSKHIVNQQVKRVDIAGNAINSAKVANNSLRGADINEASLSLRAPKWIAPSFHNPSAVSNWGSPYNPAGYFRDRQGIVHLRGLLRNVSPSVIPADSTSFFLPPGYRPGFTEIHGVFTPEGMKRLDVEPTGSVENRFLWWEGHWLSLDGITFRCAPSGQHGCP